MAKNKQASHQEKPRDASAYYKLNLKAVEDLVTADESNSPPVSEEELAKYRKKSGIPLAQWLKILLIKIWFAGAVCFFCLWGIGYYLQDQLDQMIVVGFALGVVTDLLVNNLFRFMEKTPGGNDRWMMLPQKRFATLPLNILYGYLVLLCVVMTYQVINTALISLTGAVGTIPLGVEPILFGVFTALWDTLLIKMKHVFLRIVQDARHSADQAGKK